MILSFYNINLIFTVHVQYNRGWKKIVHVPPEK